jgi:hypothetical protein
LNWSFYLYLAKSTNYKLPHCAAFSTFLQLHIFLVKIFSTAPCSQRPSVFVPTLMSETKFCTHTNHRPNFSLVYSNFYVFAQQMRRRKILDWMVGSITRIQSQLNFLFNHIWFVTVIPKYLNFDIFSNDLYAIFMSWFLPAF